MNFAMNHHKHTNFQEYIQKTSELYMNLNIFCMALDNMMGLVMDCRNLAIGDDFNVLNECYKRLASMLTYTNDYTRLLLLNVELANRKHYHRKRKKEIL